MFLLFSDVEIACIFAAKSVISITVLFFELVLVNVKLIPSIWNSKPISLAGPINFVPYHSTTHSYTSTFKPRTLLVHYMYLLRWNFRHSNVKTIYFHFHSPSKTSLYFFLFWRKKNTHPLTLKSWERGGNRLPHRRGF